MSVNSMQLELPPVLQILMSEPLDVRDFVGFAKRIDVLRPELRRQAQWSLEHFDYFTGPLADPYKFISYPTSGIDPFGTNGACIEPICRVGSAFDFARTVGLYSDIVVLTDPFTRLFVDATRKLKKSQLEFLHTRLMVAKVLEPLIRASVIRFQDGYYGLCSDCDGRLRKQIRIATSQYLSENASSLNVETLSKRTIAFQLPHLFEPNVVFRLDLGTESSRRFNDPDQRAAMVSELMQNVVEEQAHETIVNASFAGNAGAVLLSNSRVGLSALLQMEGRRPNSVEVEYWETERTTHLPWVRDLTPTEVLRLRDEAETALPRFRAKFATAFRSDSNGNEPGKGDTKSLVREIRGEAEEVRAELNAANVSDEHRFRNVAGAVGLGVAMYGLATDLPMLALSSLVTVLGLVHATGRREDHEHAKLTSRPGYVLVKAAEILKHRDPVPPR